MPIASVSVMTRPLPRRAFARASFTTSNRRAIASVTPWPVAPDKVSTSPLLARFRAARFFVDLGGGQGVDLVEADDLALLGKAVTVALQLAAHGAPIGDHVIVGAVDQMEDRGAALEMAEEAMAKAGAFAGAFDQAGQIGHDELVAMHADHAELRLQCGEGIIRDFRPRARYRRK